MKNGSVQLLSLKAPSLPLTGLDRKSGGAQWRDLRFGGSFLRVFFDRALNAPSLRCYLSGMTVCQMGNCTILGSFRVAARDFRHCFQNRPSSASAVRPNQSQSHQPAPSSIQALGRAVLAMPQEAKEQKSRISARRRRPQVQSPSSDPAST
jgi:hypothetical protein